MFEIFNVRTLRNEIADLKDSHERALTRMAFANDLEKTQLSREMSSMIAERDARILKLEGDIIRITDEMEARLNSQEDIHLNEIIALESICSKK